MNELLINVGYKLSKSYLKFYRTITTQDFALVQFSGQLGTDSGQQLRFRDVWTR